MDILYAAIALFVAQWVKGITGFGSSLVAIPLLTLLWGPAEAIAVGAACDLLAGMGLAVQVWRRMDWPLILAMFLPSLIGIQLGAMVLGTLPLDWLLTLMGSVVGLMGARYVWRPVQEGHGELEALPESGPLWAQAVGVGFLGGLSAGTIGAGGPPVVLWMRRWFTDRYFRAQVIALMALSAMTMPPVLFLNGLVAPSALLRVPLLLPAVVAGAGLGAWMSPRLSREAFGRFVGAVLLGIGLVLVGRAVRGALW